MFNTFTKLFRTAKPVPKEKTPLWTQRIGYVSKGLYIINTTSGQIGTVEDWTDKAIVMTVHSSTAGYGEDTSAQGLQIADNKDNFRLAGDEEIQIYVKGIH